MILDSQLVTLQQYKVVKIKKNINNKTETTKKLNSPDTDSDQINTDGRPVQKKNTMGDQPKYKRYSYVFYIFMLTKCQLSAADVAAKRRFKKKVK